MFRRVVVYTAVACLLGMMPPRAPGLERTVFALQERRRWQRGVGEFAVR